MLDFRGLRYADLVSTFASQENFVEESIGFGCFELASQCHNPRVVISRRSDEAG